MMPKSRHFRVLLFNAIDALKGYKNKKHYQHIKQYIENSLDNTVQLEKLLQHAFKTTPFYQEVNQPQELAAFPVINKNKIKANYQGFQSQSFKPNTLSVAATSGSMGTPFKVLQNREKRLRNTADTLCFSELAGYRIGYKLYYFRLWKAYEAKSLWAKWIQNIVPIDVYDLKEDQISHYIETWKNHKGPKSWTGYASAFETICKHLDRVGATPTDIRLKSVIAISESLSPYTKQKLKYYFNVDTVSRYSNVENGIIAQQLPGSSHFIINTASYHVEILDFNNNAPVKHGQKGRIVITDLYNFAMPMIRYDTGDIGAMDIVNGQKVLTAVEGRKVDCITNTKGDIVPNSLMMLVNNYHELNQCQLVQKSANTYVLKVNIDGNFKNENKFIEDFKTYLGGDAHIKIEYVHDIPLLNSGKWRSMVNEMHQ